MLYYKSEFIRVMNNETLRKAVRVLEKDLRRLGKPGSRVHDDTAQNNVNRLRAIEGICGSCTHFTIEIFRKDNRKRVSLRCLEGLSPLELYRKTEIGKEASCKKFSGINPNIVRLNRSNI